MVVVVMVVVMVVMVVVVVLMGGEHNHHLSILPDGAMELRLLQPQAPLPHQNPSLRLWNILLLDFILFLLS